MSDALAVQEAQDGQVLTPKIEACRQRVNYPVSEGITTYLTCIAARGHAPASSHVSHPFKNIFSGEIEYIVWHGEDDRSKVDFVVDGFDTFTCKHCHLDNHFHDVEEPCWSCGTMNPRSNYNFDP